MARKIRIECEQRTREGGILTDLRTGKQGMFYRGESVTFELSLFANGRMLSRADLTNIKVRLLNNITLLSETLIPSASLSSSITAQQWRQGVAALATVNFSAAATGDLPAGMLTMQVLGTISGTESVYASGTIESATLYGLITGTPPTPGPPTSYTKAESDALYEDAGAAAGLAADIADLQAFTDHAGETYSGGFVRAVVQSLSDSQKQQVRENIGAAVAGGTDTITGRESYYDVGTGLMALAQTSPNGLKAAITVVTPGANTDIRLTAPNIPVGVVRMLKIQQGYIVHWSSHYTFPTGAITCGASAESGYSKKSWHPTTGEGYEKFELLNDGTTTHVRRWRPAALPDSGVDVTSDIPFLAWNGTAITSIVDRHYRTTVSGGAGTPGYANMTGSNHKGVSYNGTNNAHSFPADPPNTAIGFALAMVFTATASTSQRILFSSNALGIQVVADTDGMRIQAWGGASGSGLLVAPAYNVSPVAFVAVIRPTGTGAFVLSTATGSSAQTGSFSVTAGVQGGEARWGGEIGGWTKGLACIVARTQIYRTALTPDQARAVLDSLTEYYKLS